MLDPRRLTTLLVVARTTSLTAAARELGVTQPAIAQQLRALEVQVGTALVVRAGRGVRLTDAGVMLARRAEPILLALASAQDELATLTRDGAGRVRVVVSSGTLDERIARALAMVQDQRPTLSLSLEEVPGADAMDRLVRGECDVAVVPDIRGAHQHDLLHHAVIELCTFAAVARDHPLARSGAVTLADLVDEQLTVDHEQLPKALRAGFAAIDVEPSYRAVVGDRYSALSAAAEGLGIALLNLSSTSTLSHPRAVVIPLAPTIVSRYTLATRGGGKATEASTAVLDALTLAASGRSSAPPL